MEKKKSKYLKKVVSFRLNKHDFEILKSYKKQYPELTLSEVLRIMLKESLCNPYEIKYKSIC